MSRSSRSGSSSSPSCGPVSSSWRVSTSGVGMLHGDRRHGRSRAPGRHQHDRAAVGRQRGLADRGRARHVRRVPRLVRDHVLRLYLAMVLCWFAHHPGRGLRVPRQARRGALAPHLGCPADHGQPARPAADRRGPGRPAERTAHQRQPELHGVVLGPAPALRRIHRGDVRADLPAARGDVPVPENHRRHARAILAPARRVAPSPPPPSLASSSGRTSRPARRSSST